MITQDELKDVMAYNPTTGIFVWKKINKMCGRRRDGEVAGSPDKRGYRKVIINRKYYLCHRLAWFYVYGEWPNIIDHINGIRDDNRILNLRNVDIRTNAQNMEYHRRGNLAGIRPRKHGKWQARIGVDGVTTNIGTFDTKEEAYTAYIGACKDPYALKKYPQKSSIAKVESGIPVGVHYSKSGKSYTVKISINRIKYIKWGFKTLESAIEHLESIKKKDSEAVYNEII